MSSLPKSKTQVGSHKDKRISAHTHTRTLTVTYPNDLWASIMWGSINKEGEIIK